MSTTWAFLGFISGRELGMHIPELNYEKILHGLKLMFRDLLLASVGLGVSILLLIIQNPN